MRTNDLVKFIKAREAVRIAKEADKPRPWTTDSILDKYRFCNVHREDDAVTKWLRASYYPCFENDPDIWFAAVVARLLNNPEALDEVAIQRKTVLPWKPAAFQRILAARKAEGEKNFNAAYIVSTNGVAMEKVEYLVKRVLGPLWAARKFLRPTDSDTLETFYNRISDFDGIAGFMGGQIIADLKYIPPLKFASDWWTFAASGPGSRRGLNRVLGRDVNATMFEAEWHKALTILLSNVNFRLAAPLHAQDLQNCLCEFDKYERARLGEGTPKQIYKEK